MVICLTVRGAQPEFSIPQDVPELGADAPHLKVEVLAGQAGHRDVVEGVDADLMALPGHAADQLLIALKAVSQQKEGGGHLPQGQLVQKAAVVDARGPSSKVRATTGISSSISTSAPPEAARSPAGWGAGERASAKHSTSRAQLIPGAP